MASGVKDVKSDEDSGELIIEYCGSRASKRVLIPCTCKGNPDDDGGEYPPAPEGATLCEQATYYTVPAYNIMATLQTNFIENYPDTYAGWQGAAALTANNFKLPASFITTAAARMATVPYHDNFLENLLPTDGSPECIAMFQAVGCVFYAALIDGFGALNYDILRAKFQEAGLIGFGQLVTAIPLATLNEKSFLFATNAVDSYGFVTSVNCEACDDEPPSTGTDCEDCGLTDCNRWLPGLVLNPGVSGFDNVGVFGSSGQPYWFCENGNLTIDLGSNKCVERVLVRNYTPQGAGGTIRSNLLRFELDNVPVSDFKGQAFGAINPGDCGVQNDFVTILTTTDGNPKLGRYVKIVGNNGQEFIVQVDVITCLDE